MSLGQLMQGVRCWWKMVSWMHRRGGGGGVTIQRDYS